jgi:hypothetical protein
VCSEGKAPDEGHNSARNMLSAGVHRCTLKTSLRPEQDWKQHRTGHHTVNRGCVCTEGKAPDDGHNSARNMLSIVQVNK